jgi:hypothetical protein
MAFVGRAQQQAERILMYAAGGGLAALVDLATGRLALSTGLVDPETVDYTARQLRESLEEQLAIGPATIVGRVGTTLALIVWLDPGVPSSAVCSDRVAKARDLLTRMLVARGAPPNPPSGSEPSGAPAEVFDMLPPDWKRRFA